MPHNASKIVRGWDFFDDFCHYYKGTVVTYNGVAALIRDVSINGDNNRSYEDLTLYLRTVPQRGDPQTLTVNAAEVNYEFPTLGWIKTTNGWYYVSRRPRRRRTKGFCNNTASGQDVTGRWCSLDVMSSSVIRQIWYGNTERINNECIILADGIMFGIEKVCNIVENEVTLIEGKEKIGRYACKLLRNFIEGTNSHRNLIIRD
jgi:hypothetical protein